MPGLGWQAPDRKPAKITIPMTEDTAARLDKLAAKRGISKTIIARELLLDGLKRARV